MAGLAIVITSSQPSPLRATPVLMSLKKSQRAAERSRVLKQAIAIGSAVLAFPQIELLLKFSGSLCNGEFAAVISSKILATSTELLLSKEVLQLNEKHRF